MQGVAKTPKEYAATEARARFSDLFDAAYFGERVVVTKRDRQVAIVSMSFIERVDRLLEIEAELEAIHAKAALKEFQAQGGKSMDDLEKEIEVD